MTSKDFKDYIIQNKKIITILEYLECERINTDHPKFIRCSINGKNNNALSINSENLKVTDFGNSNLEGDIFSLYMNIKNTTFGQCMFQLHKMFGLKYDKIKIDKKVEIKNDPMHLFKNIRKKSINVNDNMELKKYDDSILDNFIPMLYKDWSTDIVEPTRNLFGVGFSTKHNRIIIPHKHYETGELVGVVGRTVNELHEELNIPKYFPILKYEKSKNVYGLYENYKHIQKNGYATVFEGEKSVLKRHSRFDKTGVSIGCHEIHQKQVEILKSLNVEIVIAFDKDVKIYDILKNCEKFYPLKNVSFIFDKNGILGDKDSPADTNMKNYNLLFKNRICYGEKLHNKFIELKKRR